MTCTRIFPAVAAAVSLLIGAACSQKLASDSNEFGEILRGAAPAGSSAAIVGNTLPTTVAAGDIISGQVTVQNNGTVAWTSPSWMLHMVGTYYGWVASPLPSGTTVSPGQTITFNITGQVPAGAVSGHFRAQMQVNQGGVGGFFGQVLDVSITVGGALTHDAVLASSTIPMTVAVGDIINASVTAQNTGSATWNSPSYMVHVTPSSPNYYGFTYSALPNGTSIATGGTFTFPVHFIVPASASTGHLRLQMFQSGTGGGYFGGVLDVPVTVGGTAKYTDSFASNTVPGTMSPGQIVNAQVVVTNDGTATWDSTVQLRAVGANGYGFSSIAIANGVTIAPTVQATFNISFRVPAGATTGHFQVQMFLSGSNGGPFGPILDVPVHVSSGTSVTYSDSFVFGDTPTAAQCDTWHTFLAALPASGGSFTSVHLFGSNDPTGITCTNPTAVNQIANALHNNVDFIVTCDGHTWNNCNRGGGVPAQQELWIDPPTECSTSPTFRTSNRRFGLIIAVAVIPSLADPRFQNFRTAGSVTDGDPSGSVGESHKWATMSMASVAPDSQAPSLVLRRLIL